MMQSSVLLDSQSKNEKAMNRRYIAFLVLLAHLMVVTLPGFAQNVGELRIDYDNDAQGQGGVRIFQTSYGYLIFSGNRALESDYLSILTTAVDANGNTIHQKRFASDTCNYAWNLNTQASRLNDSVFMIFAQESPNSYEYMYSRLYYIDYLGDSINTTYPFGRPSDISDGGYFLIETYLDTSVVCGQQNSAVGNQERLVKIDSEGEIINSYASNAVSWANPYCALKTDEAYITSGITALSGPEFYSGQQRQYFRKWNLDGTVAWTRYYQSPPIGREAPIANMLLLPDGNILYAGGRSAGVDTGMGETFNGNTRPVIGVLDAATGDTLWERGYGEYDWFRQFRNLKALSDGGYLAVGNVTQNPNDPNDINPVSYMVRLNANLETVWERKYVPVGFEGWGRWNELSDVVENDNGTFTAAGFIYTHTGTGPQGGYVQDIFLLTVDQDGCVVPNCGVSVREWEPEEEQPVLYPNPSAGFSTVRLASPAVAQWQVYDGRGALVLSGEQEHRQQIDLQGQSLVPGLYHVRITQADKVYTLPWMVTSR